MTECRLHDRDDNLVVFKPVGMLLVVAGGTGIEQRLLVVLDLDLDTPAELPIDQDHIFVVPCEQVARSERAWQDGLDPQLDFKLEGPVLRFQCKPGLERGVDHFRFQLLGEGVPFVTPAN